MTASFLPRAPWHGFAKNTPSRTSKKSSSQLSIPTTSTRKPTDLSLRNVGIVYRKELLEALRDRRTLMSTILIPLLLFPVLAVGMGYATAEIFGEAEREPSKIIILGGADSPDIIAGLQKAKKLQVMPMVPNYVDLISNKKIRAVVDIPPGFQAAIAHGEHPVVKIYTFSGDFKSSFGATRIEKFFTEYRDDMVRSRLASANLPESLMKPFETKQHNVVSAEKVAGELYGGFIPHPVLLIAIPRALHTPR